MNKIVENSIEALALEVLSQITVKCVRYETIEKIYDPPTIPHDFKSANRFR